MLESPAVDVKARPLRGEPLIPPFELRRESAPRDGSGTGVSSRGSRLSDGSMPGLASSPPQLLL